PRLRRPALRANTNGSRLLTILTARGKIRSGWGETGGVGPATANAQTNREYGEILKPRPLLVPAGRLPHGESQGSVLSRGSPRAGPPKTTASREIQRTPWILIRFQGQVDEIEEFLFSL